MSDVLIRNVPDEVLAVIDVHAARLGLSRTEYVRRRLVQDVRSDEVVSAAELRSFAETFADLGNETVMSGAWS